MYLAQGRMSESTTTKSIGNVCPLCLILTTHLPATGISDLICSELYCGWLNLGRGDILRRRLFGLTLHYAPVSILNVTCVLFMSSVTDQFDLSSLLVKTDDGLLVFV